MYRFVHGSDIHIEKHFGNLSKDFSRRLRDTRHSLLERLAKQAGAIGAAMFLLAGDTETPTPAMLC